MLSVIEPDGAENFSIGQIIQVRELKVPREYNFISSTPLDL